MICVPQMVLNLRNVVLLVSLTNLISVLIYPFGDYGSGLLGKITVPTLETNVSICTCTYVVFMQFKKTSDSSLKLEQMTGVAYPSNLFFATFFKYYCFFIGGSVVK